MNDFRFLIVEDEDDARQQLAALFREVFPNARIDAGGTVDEGLQLIRDAVERKEPYDIAILDFKLPRSQGENPEVDESLCIEIRDSMPRTLIGHITGFPDDPTIESHVERTHPFTDPRGFFIDKRDADWATVLLNNTTRYLYTFRIEAQMEQLFGRAGMAATPAGEYARFSASGPGVSLTTSIASLCSDIGQCWKYLDGTAKHRIATQFSVDESSDPPFVVLK